MPLVALKLEFRENMQMQSILCFAILIVIIRRLIKSNQLAVRMLTKFNNNSYTVGYNALPSVRVYTQIKGFSAPGFCQRTLFISSGTVTEDPLEFLGSFYLWSAKADFAKASLKNFTPCRNESPGWYTINVSRRCELTNPR